MQDFASEYKTLQYVIETADRVLLFAHTRPDPDAVGASVALKEYIESLGKVADIACFDGLPEFAEKLFPVKFLHPDEIDYDRYEAVIASDSVDRGFHRIADRIPGDKVTALIDHHPNIRMTGDIVIIDTKFCSSSEIVYRFLKSQGKEITPNLATPILMGILGDTGGLQHSNTTPEVMEIVSDLIRQGAKFSKIIECVFTNNDLSTLRLWGKALSRAKINPENGMIYSALTEEDLKGNGCPTPEELSVTLSFVASILSQAPDAKFSMLFYQLDPETVRARLRTEPSKDTDVSAVARMFGGGGHELASGFEIKGRIVETSEGWEIR